MKRFSILVFLILSRFLPAQNLVTNGGFETYSVCPSFYGEIAKALGWLNCNGSSPDYLHRCDVSNGVGVPLNSFGVQQPHGGDGYAGIVLLFSNPIDFREYLQTRLSAPLQAGVCYRLEMYVSLEELTGKYTTDDWGAYFSVLPLTNMQSQLNFSVTPQLINPLGNYPDTMNWKLSTSYYYANGGEEYITIGNFKTNANTKAVVISGGQPANSIAIFVDDISLTACLDVGLDKYDEKSSDRVFPTRFNNELNVSINSIGDAQLLIYNKSGELVAEKIVKGNCTIDTQSWPPDFYFFQLRRGSTIISSGKLIKE